VRVGRVALDEEAIRLIEEHHPQVRFDWPQILNGEEEAAAPDPPRREPAERVPDAAAAAPAAEAPILPPPEQPINPAHARLGSEGLARLRARYADVAATITRRIPDEQRRHLLREQAVRLDPDSWVTDEEVRRGLEEYEGVLASLREVVGRRRRRRRSRAVTPPSGQPPDRGAPDQAPDQQDEEGGEEGGEPGEP
jgi:hypothetical protein